MRLMSNDIILSLPLPWPPTINTYWRNVNGRTLLSKKGREYKRTVWQAVAEGGGRLRLACPIAVEIVLHPPTKAKMDIDNRIKALLDAMQDASVYVDDSQVEHLTVIRGDVIKGGVAAVAIKARAS